MIYVRYIGARSLQARPLTTRISHPDRGLSDPIQKGEILHIDWQSPVRDPQYVELTKQEVDEILAAQIVDAVDPEPEPVEVEEEEAPVPGSGILPSPDSFVARRKSGDLTFFSARSEIKELTDGAVKGRTYDRLLENYAAWHMAVGQGLDG